MSDLLRHVGKFQIAARYLADETVLFRRILAGCIVVKAEHLFVDDIFEYTALNEEFDFVPVGETIPCYWLKAPFHEGGDIEWERQP